MMIKMAKREEKLRSQLSEVKKDQKASTSLRIQMMTKKLQGPKPKDKGYNLTCPREANKRKVKISLVRQPKREL